MRKKVVVGLSGGVDSAIAASVLLKRGYEVVGVFLRIYRNEDEPAAGKVAEHLGIPLLVLDVREEFRRKIMGYFAEEYRRGRTPNPCAFCNPEIKFRYLLQVAEQEGAELVATGHYARVVERQGEFFLTSAKDRRKSQEYFLAMLKPSVLKRIIFPLGELTKEEVRGMAEREEIPALYRGESQDVCFVEGQYWKFLEKVYSFKPIPGKILHTSGKVLGTHSGFYRYTVGQRRGLGVSSTFLGLSTPLYVVRVSANENSVVVGSKEEAYKEKIDVELKLWRGKSRENYRVKIRYRHPGAKAQVKTKEGLAEVFFEKPQFAPAPGQLAVFYDREELVMGAGVIL